MRGYDKGGRVGHVTDTRYSEISYKTQISGVVLGLRSCPIVPVRRPLGEDGRFGHVPPWSGGRRNKANSFYDERSVITA